MLAMALPSIPSCTLNRQQTHVDIVDCQLQELRKLGPEEGGAAPDCNSGQVDRIHDSIVYAASSCWTENDAS